MNREAYEKWVAENSVHTTEKYFNNIRYAFCELRDGWIAVWQISKSGEYTPFIQAASLACAERYCNLVEPVTVPMTELVP